jgi:hypothetical protein
VTGVEVVTDSVVLTGTMPSLTVSCPTGKVALSGGAQVDVYFAGTLVLRTSAPVVSSGLPVGWFAVVTTTNGASIPSTWQATLTVSAVCASVQ